MSAGAAPERQQQEEELEQLCAAAVRALTGVPDLHFRGGALHRAAAPVHAPAPHLRTHSGVDDLGSHRGAADGLALRLLHSDPDRHRAAAPDDEVGALVFELLEQFRVESLADPQHRGSLANLRHRHETWSAQFHASGLTETAVGLALYTVAQAGRAHVTGQPVVEATEDLLEATRFGLAPLIGQDLARLRATRHDQASYAVHARRIADTVASLVAEAATSGRTPPDRDRGTDGFTVALTQHDVDGDGEGGPEGGSRAPVEAGSYEVFTRAYDREVPMTRLTRRAQLLDLRHELDDLVDDSGLQAAALARRLAALVDSERTSGWDTAQEEGLVDPGRLSRLVTRADDPRVFRTQREEPVADLHVTLLLDCSGSMRHHREHTAVMVDVLVRALDLVGIDSEVLGFTTGAWNGGRALRDWNRAGKPARPGRLNERLHVVVKDTDTRWRRARVAIAGLLRPDVYRETLDGEAVEWAVERVRARQDGKRQVLLVLSDGSPNDAATAQTNGADYLDRHLVHVLDDVVWRGDVAVTGLGVATDLSRYYAHSCAVDLDTGADQRLMRVVVDALHEASRRRRAW